MFKAAHNLSIRLRIAIHDLVILLPKGIRSSLSGSMFLTRIFLFFDTARYIPLKSDPADQVLDPSDSPSLDVIPISAYNYIEPKYTNGIENKLADCLVQPYFSIIISVFNTDIRWLKLAIQSIEHQWYKHWELCLVDDCSSNSDTLRILKSLKDPRIKIHYSVENQGISVASNIALSMTTGDYIALMDHDDELTPDALYEVVKTINEQGAEFIYSDEDKLEMDGTSCEPHFKPDFSPDMFLSQNYLSHLTVIKKSLIDQVGGFTTGLDGAQDYDLYLKVLEHTGKVAHIAKVLYHWRKIPGSTAAAFDEKSYAQDAGAKALTQALHRRKSDAEILSGKFPGTYRAKYTIESHPLVSIIIPFKDKPELLRMSIESVLQKSSYRNFEIIGISNNSEEQDTFDEMRRLVSQDDRVSFFEYNLPFNFSEINNYAVNTHARGEHILLLNNNIQIINDDWIESLLEFSQREDVGVVGGKLYYPEGNLQHAGVIIGIGGIAGHSHKYLAGQHHGYFSRPHLVQNLSAVTGACLMVKKKIYEAVDGLNAEKLAIAFNDIDFCLRIREMGYLNVFTPYCEAFHHESKSRGYEITKEQQIRFDNEVAYMAERHSEILKNGDIYYNRNLTLLHEDFSLAESSQIPKTAHHQASK